MKRTILCTLLAAALVDEVARFFDDHGKDRLAFFDEVAQHAVELRQIFFD